MLVFLSDCAGLFTDTFNAALGLDFFMLLAAFLVIRISFALFFHLCRKSQRM